MKKKKYRLRNLKITSVHFVFEPAVQAAKFLIKKEKGGNSMDDLKKEVQLETEEEKKIEQELAQPAQTQETQEVEKARKKTFLDVTREFIEKIKTFDDVPDKLKKLVAKIEEFMSDYSYGYPEAYPEPTKKSIELIEKYKKEVSELKAKLWEYEMISKGKPPAVVKKLVEIIKSNEEILPIATELIDAIPSVNTAQISSQEAEAPIQRLQEKVEKIAKMFNW